ncbi:MAG: FKBP-type peptidyl-prolyl cis-trans isomerase [Bacteroidota bacterium]
MKTLLLFCLFFVGLVPLIYAQNDTIKTMTGVKYVRLQPGNGQKPQLGDKLWVLYTGKLENGRVFDSSMDNTIPFKFKLGKGEVIPGWDEGFRMMTEGEKGILLVPSHMAYGETGSGYLKKDDTYVVPPNSNLIFEVELLKIK